MKKEPMVPFLNFISINLNKCYNAIIRKKVKQMKWITWTKPLVEAFIEEGNLNERQIFLLRTRVKGYTIAEQARLLNLSVDQINKDIAKLRKIYDETSKNSKVLPERK